MIKKTLITLLLMVASLGANAQVFVGGSAGVAYNGDFSAALKTFAGYEFNQRFAVGGGVNVGVIEDYSYIQVEPFVRFNCWNNSRLFFDLKAKGTIDLTDDEIQYETGIVPSLRYRFSDHWDASVDLGLIGYSSSYDDFVVSAKTTNVCLSVIYRF